MKSFSGILKSIITGNDNITIYAMAREINCERTRLQKIITGERECPMELIRPICDYLTTYVSAAIVDELYEVWANHHYGYNRYQTLVNLKKRLEETKKNEIVIDKIKKERKFEPEDFLSIFVLEEDEKKIVSVLYKMFKNEMERADKGLDCKLYIYVPSTWSRVRQILMYLINLEYYARDLSDMGELLNTIDLRIAFSNSIANDEDIEFALIDNYISSCEFSIYDIRTYSDFGEIRSVDGKDMMPYYIISSEKIIFMTEQKELVEEFTEQKNIDKLASKFVKAIEQKEFVTYMLTNENYVHNVHNHFIEQKETFSISNRFCDGTWYTREIMDKGLSKGYPQRNITIELIVNAYENFKTGGENQMVLLDGLFEYISESDKSEDELFCLTNEAKYSVLNAVYEYYDSTDLNFAIILPERFNFHTFIHLSATSANLLNFINYQNRKSVLLNKMNFMTEDKIGEIIMDFFEYISNSSACLNKKQSLNIIKSCINTLAKTI